MFQHTLRLIEKFDAHTVVKLARAVLMAQDFREESWDDVTKQYTRTNFMAASEAVQKAELDPFYEELIGAWNNFYWNDIQSWADTVMWHEAVKN